MQELFDTTFTLIIELIKKDVECMLKGEFSFFFAVYENNFINRQEYAVLQW